MLIEIMMMAAIGTGDACGPYPAGRVGSGDLVASFAPRGETREVNGRLWSGTVVAGGVASGRPSDRAYAAAAYGAADMHDAAAVVAIDGLFDFEGQVTGVISPWEPVRAASHTRYHADSHYSNPFSNARRRVAERLEDARNDWLRDNGFTGGVRTFVSDAAPAGAKADAGEIKPRGVIELSPEVTQFKSRMQVNAAPARVAPAGQRVIRVTPETRIADGGEKQGEPVAQSPEGQAGA